MCPLAQSDGHDAPGLIGEAVPGEAAMVEDVVVRFEDALRQPVVAHKLPDVFDRIELGAFWTCPDKVESFLPMRGELDEQAEGFYAGV